MKNKYYWVTRERYGAGWYNIYDEKPQFQYDRRWEGMIIETFCPFYFEKLTGIKLKGGPRGIIKIRGFKPIKA